MTPDPDCAPTAALGELADELLCVAVNLRDVVADSCSDDAPGPEAVASPASSGPRADDLRRVLSEILQSRLTGYATAEVVHALGVMRSANDAISRDLRIRHAATPPRLRQQGDSR